MTLALRLVAVSLLTACAAQPTRVDPPQVAAPLPPEPAPTLRLDGRARPVRYAVRLALSPASETFSGTLDLALAVDAPLRTLWMHGEGLEVSAATLTLAGKVVTAEVTRAPNGFLGFTFPAAVGPGAGTLAVTWSGKVRTTARDGLYRQLDHGNAYLYTDFEPSDARRVFPCFDEPLYKVPWALSLTVPEGLAAFANMPVAREEQDAAARTRTLHFQPTPPLPSYLVAFAVGPFEVVEAGTAGRSRTPIRVITPKGKADRAAYAVSITGPLLEKLEAYFDSPHPFPKLDLISVPQQGGAMENPGLITYGESILLAKPGEQSLRFRRRQMAVTAHELAHQWFGDLVTLRWWDDIWLNESFASWMETRIVREQEPKWATDEDAVEELHEAFEADSLVSARKIRQPIESQSDVLNAFDRITYAKGGSVLRMLEAWVGPQKLQAGVRAYLAKHAWKTTVGADFLDALSESSGQDVRALFASFVDQPGLPVVTAELQCQKGGPIALALSQHRYLPLGSSAPDEARWQLPVCVRYDAGKQGARACALLSEPTAVLPLPEAKGCPRWVAANAGAVGYYRVLMKGAALSAPGLTVAERLAALDDAGALARSGALDLKDALTLAAREAKSGEPHLVAKSIELTEAIEQHLVPDSHRAAYGRFVQKTFGSIAQKLGLQPSPSEEPAVSRLRLDVVALIGRHGHEPALAAKGRVLAQRWLEDPASLDPDLVRPVMALAGASGDAALYDRLLQRAQATKDAPERSRLILALAQFRTPALVQRSLQLFTDPAFDPWELQPLVRAALETHATARAPYDYVRENYAQVAARLPESQLARLSGVGAVLCDPKGRQEVDAFFAPRSGAAPGGRRLLAQTLERIDQCALFKARQQPSVTAFLSRY